MRPHPTVVPWLAPVLLAGVLACSVPEPEPFEHDFPAGPTPWTHEDFDADEGRFTFAVFSDLNGGERPGVFEVAVEQLSLLRPGLVLSVGDLIDGGTEDRATLAGEWDDFDERARRSRAPVFRVGGNHDLTNVTMRRVWAQRYGARYYHFVYEDVLFLVLDTEDYSEERMREIYLARAAALEARERGADGVEEMEYYRMPERITGDVGPEQSRYFQDVLARHRDVRWTMLFMHKPVWRDDGDPEFVTIESALADRPYTVFNGHLHALAHAVKNGRDYITLGTTGGGQDPDGEASFDHVTLVTMTDDGPSIAHLRMDGILDRTGRVPAGGDTLCFQASACGSAAGG